MEVINSPNTSDIDTIKLNFIKKLQDINPKMGNDGMPMLNGPQNSIYDIFYMDQIPESLLMLRPPVFIQKFTSIHFYLLMVSEQIVDDRQKYEQVLTTKMILQEKGVKIQIVKSIEQAQKYFNNIQLGQIRKTKVDGIICVSFQFLEEIQKSDVITDEIKEVLYFNLDDCQYLIEEFNQYKKQNKLSQIFRRGIRIKDQLYKYFAVKKALPNFIRPNDVHYFKKILKQTFILLNLKAPRELVLKKFSELARENFPHEQKSISQFEDLYQANHWKSLGADKIFHQYTKQSFLYKFINNKSRRDWHPLQIYYIQPVFKDIFLTIKSQYNKKKNKNSLTLYRKAIFSKEEIQYFQTSKGSYIANKGFMSTSMSRSAVSIFQGNVLLEIQINHQLQQQNFLDFGYVQISDYSKYKGQQQVLMNFLCTFKILDIQEEQEQDLTIIKLQYGISQMLSKSIEQGIQLKNEKIQFVDEIKEYQKFLHQEFSQGEAFQNSVLYANYKKQYQKLYNNLQKKTQKLEKQQHEMVNQNRIKLCQMLQNIENNINIQKNKLNELKKTALQHYSRHLDLNSYNSILTEIWGDLIISINNLIMSYNYKQYEINCINDNSNTNSNKIENQKIYKSSVFMLTSQNKIIWSKHGLFFEINKKVSLYSEGNINYNNIQLFMRQINSRIQGPIVFQYKRKLDAIKNKIELIRQRRTKQNNLKQNYTNKQNKIVKVPYYTRIPLIQKLIQDKLQKEAEDLCKQNLTQCILENKNQFDIRKKFLELSFLSFKLNKIYEATILLSYCQNLFKQYYSPCAINQKWSKYISNLKSPLKQQKRKYLVMIKNKIQKFSNNLTTNIYQNVEKDIQECKKLFGNRSLIFQALQMLKKIIKNNDDHDTKCIGKEIEDIIFINQTKLDEFIKERISQQNYNLQEFKKEQKNIQQIVLKINEKCKIKSLTFDKIMIQ